MKKKKKYQTHQRHGYTITDGYSLVNELDIESFTVCVIVLTSIIS